MANLRFILIATILLAIQCKTFALNCYHCEFGRDGCGKSFSATGAGVIQLSAATNTYCVKQVYASNTNAISRDGTAAAACAAGTITVTASTSGTIQDGYTVHCCTTDLCNGASMKCPSILVSLAIAMLSLILYWK